LHKRQIIIGDIHGCIEELLMLLKKVNYDDNNDELFFVGDLINKGPESLKVLELCLEKKVRFVLGNHELGFIRNYHQKSNSKYFAKLANEFGDSLEFWIHWLESQPLYIEEDKFLLVHAGLVPGKTLSQTDSRYLTSIRTWDGKGLDIKNESNPPWFDFYNENKLVVFGHWAKRGLVLEDNVIGLDTGCVYGGELSALILPEKKLLHVKALKCYCPID